ncbi:zinc finger and BTB domain-containing protein 14-like isoform X1 [Macrobrachium rosenbergii]|uniref:zinc finger and BTB domain-containing protein 14-like isoform X1 n=2 Tax=Macrobrachium rosenbergii TaxID=79674 RepID=UPI0034D4A12E
MKIPESSAICQGTIMEDGLLSLKWNNHKITFCEILRTLREKSNYTDATIAVEGKFYPVHKLVLSTCSEYFEDIFARTPCKSPVIVLKDVRSQDMDALLDYMYLGEVNVNQNDLASLLKTAECLRIRGLAVPDEENTKSRKAPSDERHDSPPPKRRRHDETSRPVSPPPSANTKTPTPLPSPVQPSSAICSQSSPDHLDSDPPPHIVKVEMQEHDHEDGFRQDSYEGSVNEEGGGDFGADVSKAEHDPESYGSSSFPGPSLQPGGDLAWEEGDSSSFPPETFSSDVPAGQQPQGDDDENDGEDEKMNPSADGSAAPTTSAATSVGNPTCPPPLTPISQARQCQLCRVTLANANLLRRHVEDHHFHIRKYNCAHCGKKFKRKEHKERHERIHTGEKPFVCHICNARFTQKEHLKGHVENVHHKHGEKGLDILGDMDKDTSEQEEKEDDAEISVSSPPPPPSAGSPSLAPVSSLMTIASTPSPITSVLPIASSPPTSHVSTATPALLRSGSSSSTPVTSVQIRPSTSVSNVGVNQVTALYAPVTRKTVNSPNKHMQTITINFN